MIKMNQPDKSEAVVKPHRLITCFVIISIIFISGCNIPAGPGIIHIPEQATATSTLLFPPTLTPSLTSTIITLTVSHATYCRTGPGTDYALLGTLQVGQEAEVIGQNEYHDTWVIKLPVNPPITCWLWGNYATLSGNAALVPVIQTPPTPTPNPDFSFSYRFWGVGPGIQCIYFDVKNTGATTWQSYTLQLLNVTQAISGSRNANAFIHYDDWCLPTDTQQDLTAGESGIASVVMAMPAPFNGNTFNASLTLCSEDNQAGICLTKTSTYYVP